MSANDNYADEADKTGKGCLPSLLVIGAVVVALLLLIGCRGATQIPPTQMPPAPTTGVQPQPPATTVVPAAVQVKP
jgi:hypothetical protein